LRRQESLSGDKQQDKKKKKSEKFALERDIINVKTIMVNYLGVFGVWTK
jgi:hypothetical protein